MLEDFSILAVAKASATKKLPIEKRISSRVYPLKMEGKGLLPAGLLGPVRIEMAS